jgi:HTH-type transcriptional regulator/antitoxin HigA
MSKGCKMKILQITNEEDLKEATDRLDEIWGARPGDDFWEEREKLVELISAYEDEHIYIEPPSPVDAILFRMEQGELSRKDLEPYIGSKSKVSEVLAGKRSLSKEMIRRLHEGLGIPLKSLLGLPDKTPDGFVHVEWVLPESVIKRVAAAAKEASISEEQLVAQILMTQTSIQSTVLGITDEVELQTGLGAPELTDVCILSSAA